MFMIYLTPPLSLAPALFVWSWPDPSTLGALVGLGGLGTIAHFSVVRALAAADASACAPFEFAHLPFAALLGFLGFGEVTDVDLGRGRGHRRIFDLRRLSRGSGRQAAAPRRRRAARSSRR
jgi:hypothetical protein